ncbi:MAG TPA: DUF222 domain-containing protein [Acidimicrobiia bacterium]
MFGEVRSALDVLETVARGLDPSCLDGRDAAALVELAARGKRICAAIETLAVRRVEETKVWRDGGHRSAGHWLADTTGETVGAAARTLETGRALDGLPETDAAFRAGELSETQAHEITGAAGADPGAERDLLHVARERGVKGLRDECRRTRASAVADDQAWARRLHANRRPHRWTDPDGTYRADVRLAPDAGARFDAALENHLRRIFAAARKAGRREPRDAYAADALVALAGEGPCKPVEVRLDLDARAARNGYVSPGERCEIPGIGPVPATTARSMLDDALVSILVKDGADITTVTKATRTIPARLRRALEARYPVCGVRGCDNDQFLEIDHVVPVADGGPTGIHNTWRLCPHHHKLKTLSGWKVVGVPGDWDLVPP